MPDAAAPPVRDCAPGRGRPGIVIAAAALALLIWGGTPILTKIAVGRLDPLVVGILRTLLAACVAGPLAVVARLPRPAGSVDSALLAASALGGFVVFPLLFSLGVERTTASHAALILAVAPVFTGLFAAILARERPRVRWALGAAMALGGEICLIGLRLGLDDSGATLAGDLLVVASCVAVTLGYVTGGRLSRTLGTWPTTVWGITWGGVALAPVLVWVGPGAAWTAVGTAGWVAVAYLAFLSSIVAYAAWYWALGHGGIARIGAYQFAQPVVSLVLAVLVLGERLTLPLVLATALIVAGIGVTQRG